MASRLEDVILRGTRASQPAATLVSPGTLYFVTLENVLERSNGTIWESYSGASGGGGGFSLSNGLLIGLEPEEQDVFSYIPGPTGPQGPAGSAGSSSVTKVTVDVAEAPLEGASTTPITLVAAPGVNKVIVPVAWWPELDLVTVYSNNPTWALRYNGIAVDLLAQYSMTTNSVTGTKLMSGVSNNPTNTLMVYATNDPRNKALMFRLNADLTGAGVATAKIHLMYGVIDTF